MLTRPRTGLFPRRGERYDAAFVGWPTDDLQAALGEFANRERTRGALPDAIAG